MRVAVISHALVIPRNRARWIALSERHPDVEVFLIVPAHWEESRYGASVTYRVQMEQRGNYAVLPVPMIKVGGHLLFQSLDLHLRQVQPDIVRIGGWSSSWMFMQALLCQRLWASHAKVLWSTYMNIYKSPRYLHQQWKQAFLYHTVDAALAGGECVREVLEHTGFDKPIYVQTEIGVDPADCISQDAADLCERLGLTGCVIGFVGALRMDKGVLDLFEAVHSLSGDWSLLVVGDGELRPVLEEQAQVGNLARHRIHFAGRVEHKDVFAYYNCMDVMVLPSHTTPTCREQFGLVLAEAMLSRVAVIGSSSGEIPYVIGDAGLVFPEKDVQALHRCLQRLVNNPELRGELAHRGYERALCKYSAAVLADEFYAICRELVAQ